VLYYFSDYISIKPLQDMLLAKSARPSGRGLVRALSIAAPKLPLHINGKRFADIICCAYDALQHSNLRNMCLLIAGKRVESKASQWIDVHNPATQEVVCQVRFQIDTFTRVHARDDRLVCPFLHAQVPQSTNAEMQSAVDAASAAFKTWSKVSGSDTKCTALNKTNSKHTRTTRKHQTRAHTNTNARLYLYL